MSLEDYGGNGADSDGTVIKPEDLLRDDEVGLMRGTNTAFVLDEDDPLYKGHLAFKKEIEEKPMLIPLDEIEKSERTWGSHTR